MSISSGENLSFDSAIAQKLYLAKIPAIKGRYYLFVNGKPLTYKNKALKLSVRDNNLAVRFGKEYIKESDFINLVVNMLTMSLSSADGRTELLPSLGNYPIRIRYDTVLKIVNIIGGWYGFCLDNREAVLETRTGIFEYNTTRLLASVYLSDKAERDPDKHLRIESENLENIYKTYLSYQLLMARDIYREGFYTKLFREHASAYSVLLNDFVLPLKVDVSPILANPIFNDAELESCFNTLKVGTCLTKSIEDKLFVNINPSSNIELSYSFGFANMCDICEYMGMDPVIIPLSVFYRIMCYQLDRRWLHTGIHEDKQDLYSHLASNKVAEKIVFYNPHLSTGTDASIIDNFINNIERSEALL